MEGLIIVWLICGFIAAAIGGRKGESGVAFIYGLLLGPLGIVLAICSSGNRRPCPFCKEPMQQGAALCPHCRSEIPEAHRGKKEMSWLKAGAIAVGVIVLFAFVLGIGLQIVAKNRTPDNSVIAHPYVPEKTHTVKK